MPFLSQLLGHPADRVAILDSDGEHSYGSITEQARALAGALNDSGGLEGGQPIAFVAARKASSVVALLAIWLVGERAVPLDPLMPLPEWLWRVKDLGTKHLIYAAENRAEASHLAQLSGVQPIEVGREIGPLVPLRLPSHEQDALILYTSGTSRSPRGVVHSFSSIEAQVKTLCMAWEWQPSDSLLHVLPLSHIHGLVCGLLCTLAAGARCELMPSFKTTSVWDRLGSGQYTLLTAVPMIYQYLVDCWEKAPESVQARWQEGSKALRLSIVGSSPTPPSVHRSWKKITSKPLLTRYGMTEAGMILSQLPEGECKVDCVGSPLPGVSAHLVDESGNEVDSGPGELEVRSPQMFKGYYGKEDLTAQAFRHGWLRTGDIAVLEGDQYRLLGRRSIDIIKSGGYRVSALEVEAMLDAHPGIQECAVLGTPCDRDGEAICACVVPASRHIDLEEIRQWLCTQVASYKLPTRLTLLDGLPKTSVGKIDKQSLKRQLSISDSA